MFSDCCVVVWVPILRPEDSAVSRHRKGAGTWPAPPRRRLLFLSAFAILPLVQHRSHSGLLRVEQGAFLEEEARGTSADQRGDNEEPKLRDALRV